MTGCLGVKNGMIGTVAQAGRGRMEVRLDGGRTVVVEESAYNNVDHGYAVTIHKAQGTTVDRAFVLASPSLDQHLAYVALSRHRDSAILYAARDELGDLVHMAERLGRSGAKTTTLDFEDRAEFLERRGVWRGGGLPVVGGGLGGRGGGGGGGGGGAVQSGG